MNKLIIRYISLEHSSLIINLMTNLIITKKLKSLDEIWISEHFPIFTTGSSIKYNLNEFKYINFINLKRGGKITFHSNGQLIIYFLLNLKIKKINIKNLINSVEKSIINTLLIFNINSYTYKKSPGIFIKEHKIVSIGFQILNNCSFYGISININMNLIPFEYINPCGYKNIKMINIFNLYNKYILYNKIVSLLLNFIINIINYKKIYIYPWKN